MHAETPCKLGLVTTWSGDLWGLRRELLPWLTYHALQGVSKIYVMYEGGDKNTLTVGMLMFVRCSEVLTVKCSVVLHLALATSSTAADTRLYTGDHPHM